MLREIIQKQLLHDLIAVRFALMLITCSVLIPLSFYTGIRNYEEDLKNYWKVIGKKESEWRINKVYSWYLADRFTVEKPPQPLSFLVSGASRSLSSSIPVSYASIPYDLDLGTEVEERFSFFTIFPFDLALVIQAILSLFAVLIVHDSICGEKEKGTLKLILSYGIPRSVVLLGKYFSGMITISLALAVGILLGCMAILGRSPGAIDGGWVHIGLIFVLSLIYLSLFLLIGIVFSAMVQRSATALISGVFFWIATVIAIPYSVIFIVDKIVKVPPDYEVKHKINQIQREFSNISRGYMLKELGFTGFCQWWDEESKKQAMIKSFITSFGFIASGERIPRFDGTVDVLCIFVPHVPISEIRRITEPVRKYFEIIEPLRAEYAKRAWAIREQYLKMFPYRKIELGWGLARIFPAFSYYEGAMIVAGTDWGAHLRFLKQVRLYWELLSRWVIEEGSRSIHWFIPEGNPDKIPKFLYSPEGIGQIIRRLIPNLMILVMLNLAFFILAYILLVRYDIR